MNLPLCFLLAAATLTPFLRIFQGPHVAAPPPEPSGCVVTSALDSGAGSLRQALADATNGATICFDVASVVLTSDELVIDKNLTLQGQGSGSLTIARSTDPGTPDFRIFNITASAVTLSGMTVYNGQTTEGGAIRVSASTVAVLLDLVLRTNFVTGNGGGVFVDGEAALGNCAFYGNVSTEGGYGGGLHNSGNIAWITNCVFAGNSAGFGGGMNNSGVMDLVDACVFAGNVADGSFASTFASGGAINNDFGNTYLTHCLLSGNSAIGATAALGYGGGLNNDFGTVYFESCTVRSNLAQSGAGALASGGGVYNGFGTVYLTNSTVSGNVALGGSGGDDGGNSHGGGLNNEFGTLYLTSSTVSGNAASGGTGTMTDGLPFGGGFYAEASGSIFLFSTIASNFLSGASGPYTNGGGIFNLGGAIEHRNIIVAANDAFDWEDQSAGGAISYGWNCIGSTNGTFTPATGDQFDVTASALNLGSLQDNGGLTFTHALLTGSVALDAGDNTDALVTDQRGQPRIANSVIDIGSYEKQ